jgi:hypothetical protein
MGIHQGNIRWSFENPRVLQSWKFSHANCFFRLIFQRTFAWKTELALGRKRQLLTDPSALLDFNRLQNLHR